VNIPQNVGPNEKLHHCYVVSPLTPKGMQQNFNFKDFVARDSRQSNQFKSGIVLNETLNPKPSLSKP
jgi:hypothetical protein